MIEHKDLDSLSKKMKSKGFTVKQAFVNRLRLLDIKVSHFGSNSKPVEISKNLIVNQTYEEMYNDSTILSRNETLYEAKKRVEKFEEIYRAVTEFSHMSPEDRKCYMDEKRPRLRQMTLDLGKIKDDCRGHA